MPSDLPTPAGPGRRGLTLTVTLSERIGNALDQWIARQPAPQPTREAAVEAMVEAALKLAAEPPWTEDPEMRR